MKIEHQGTKYNLNFDAALKAGFVTPEYQPGEVWAVGPVFGGNPNDVGRHILILSDNQYISIDLLEKQQCITPAAIIPCWFNGGYPLKRLGKNLVEYYKSR
jgi:hypothetical protein